MSTRSILLIRHAESAPDPSREQEEWELTARGRASCLELAETILSSPSLPTPTLILSSSEKKALDTGQLLANHLGTLFAGAALSGFEEQDRTGAPFFESKAAFVAAISRYFSEPVRPVLGKETMHDAAFRFKQALSQALADYPKGPFAIVTHGRVMTSFLTRYAGIDPLPYWRPLSMPAVTQIEMGNDIRVAQTILL